MAGAKAKAVAAIDARLLRAAVAAIDARLLRALP